MPHDLKETVLKPKIKKHSLDSELLSNFRPISNIRFLAKAIEKAIAFKLDYHLINSNAHELYQAPLAHIIKHHNLCSHFYADDNQIYMTFKPLINETAPEDPKSIIEAWLKDINYWMNINKLKLNMVKLNYF